MGWVSSQVHTLWKDGAPSSQGLSRAQALSLGAPGSACHQLWHGKLLLSPSILFSTIHRVSLFCVGQAQARGLLCNPGGPSLTYRTHTESWVWWFMLGIPLGAIWEVETGGSPELTEQLGQQTWWFLVSERPCLKQKGGGVWGMTPELSCDTPPHTHESIHLHSGVYNTVSITHRTHLSQTPPKILNQK